MADVLKDESFDFCPNCLEECFNGTKDKILCPSCQNYFCRQCFVPVYDGDGSFVVCPVCGRQVSLAGIVTPIPSGQVM